MPVRYIQKSATPLMLTTPTSGNASVPAANVAAIGSIARASGGNDTYDLAFNPDGTVRAVPLEIAVSFDLLASSVDANIFIADDNYQVTKIQEVHSVAGGSSAAVSVTKCTTTTAPASGTVLHGTAIDLTATANTVVSPTLVTTTSTLQLAAGNRLGIDMSGTLTGLVGVLVVYLKRIPG